MHLAKLETPQSLSFVGSHFGFGVPLFYMVSAFGLLLGYHNNLNTQADYKSYYLRRFFRIAPLFYFMIAAYIPYLWFSYDGYLVPISNIISSLLFIFNLIPSHVEGFVWASWSIGVEMVFYALLPLIIFFVRNLKTASLFLLITLFIKYHWLQSFKDVTKNPVVASFENYSFLGHIHYFAMGIFAYFAWNSIRSRKLSMRVTGLVLTLLGLIGLISLMLYPAKAMLIIVKVSNNNISAFIYQISMALCFITVVIGLCLHPTKILVNRLSCTLGKSSFSLYLWHPLIIVTLMKIGFYDLVYATTNDLFIAWTVSAVLTITVIAIIANISYRLIEVPGMKLSKRF
ncbi:MAG: peptidoglycan/LPS O-acetylase OafA/YrhL [Arenicella sp.]